jgi:hypothetical protein
MLIIEGVMTFKSKNKHFILYYLHNVMYYFLNFTLLQDDVILK